MTGTIACACNTPLNQQPAGTVPDVSGGMRDYFQPMKFEQLTKTTVGFQDVDSGTPIAFRGLVQPMKPKDLMILPEGERAWSWFRVFAEPVLKLDVDDVGILFGKQTRVMSRYDYSLYGVVEYVMVTDWQGAGP